MQQTTNECDDKCREILAGYRAGLTEDSEARRLIAAELHRARIADAVAGEKLLSSPQLYHDLRTELEELLYAKIMGQGSSSLDLDVDPSCSISAWARQLLRRARNSELRNITTRTIARVDLIDPHLEAAADREGPTAWQSITKFHNASVVDSYDPTHTDQTMNDAAEWLQSKTRHLRDNSKLEAHAATLRHGYIVPALIRPRFEERARLREVLNSDPFSAHRSVRELTALIAGDEYTGEPADKGLLALWDDYSYEHMEKVSSAPGKVSRTLVDAVLADRPRPARTALRSFRAAARAFGSGKGWIKLIDEACESFVALEFEASSSFDTTGAEYRDQRLAGRSIACRKSTDVFARVLAWPGQAFGRNEDDLYEKLDTLIRSMSDLEVEVKAA